jgi:hypothetical protein
MELYGLAIGGEVGRNTNETIAENMSVKWGCAWGPKIKVVGWNNLKKLIEKI